MAMSDFRELVDLASEKLGGSVLYATDDFFAEKENLIKAAPPVWKEHRYTDRGKWMDGWESRRKRTPGHDFAILRLGARGVVRGILVDTSFFRGNYPESCSLDACSLPPESSVESLQAAQWTEILPKSPLKGDSQNAMAIDNRFASVQTIGSANCSEAMPPQACSRLCSSIRLSSGAQGE